VTDPTSAEQPPDSPRSVALQSTNKRRSGPSAERLDVFAKVVEAGSISGAAAMLGVDKSAVSRQLARLEAELNVRLLQRTTRRLALTEVGEQVLMQARQIQEALFAVAQTADAHRQEVSGRLRVSCSMASRRVLIPLAIEFGEHFPEVTVELRTDDRLVDLIAENIDVAIRVSALVDSNLVARKLADSTRILVASPDYLRRRGIPREPDELREHMCLVYCNQTRVFDRWHFDGPGEHQVVQVPHRLQMNDGGAIADACVAGGGIALLDELLVRGDLARCALRRLLVDFALSQGPPIYAVYPARQWLAPKTAAFVEFMQTRLSQGCG
jgi:DNA-binding transcriptional LysR family regulator